MAKVKKTTTVEETEEEKTTEPAIDYKKDLENKSFDQVATDTPKEDVKEEVKEEPKVDEETETVEFDPEELVKRAKEEAKSEMADLLKGDTKEETKDNVSHYQEFQEEFLKKNNRQPTWFEVAEDMEQQAIIKLEAKQAEQVKAKEEEVTKQKEVETQNNEATNKYVKDTLDELYELDKLPKIVNKDDTDDYGLKVQNALLRTVVDINTKRIADGQTPKTIKEIFYEDFKAPRQQVAGADAPTNMGRGGFTPDDTEEINYNRDIAGDRNSFRNIITNAFKKRQ